MKKQFMIDTVSVFFFLVVILSNCSKSTETYYPLKEERTWEYQISAGSMLDSGGTAKVIVTNFAPRELKGKKVTPQKLDVGGQSYFNFIYEDDQGIYAFATQPPGAVDPEIEANPNYFIKYPIKVGTSWDYKTETSLLSVSGMEEVPVVLKSAIESTDEVVTVPAGTFKGCVMVKRIGTTKKPLDALTNLFASLRAATINVEHYDWYAPGVGNIKSIRREKSNHPQVGSGEVTSQLESFKK